MPSTRAIAQLRRFSQMTFSQALAVMILQIRGISWSIASNGDVRRQTKTQRSNIRRSLQAICQGPFILNEPLFALAEGYVAIYIAPSSST